ncbi:hypothetical protein [Bdellovibrio bacteriovorus]|uniref:hypothetical protein n=1 Tax=Bdellovibrio bacteriovorus TaxID=959 RepID=UPI0035A5FCC2
MKLFLSIFVFLSSATVLAEEFKEQPDHALFCSAKLSMNGGHPAVFAEGVTTQWQFNSIANIWEISFTKTLPYPLRYTGHSNELGDYSIIAISKEAVYSSNTNTLHAALPERIVLHNGKKLKVNQLDIRCAPFR